MDIIRTHLITWEGLGNLVIDGLQIKAVNAGTESLEDPMRILLREVLTAVPCAAMMSAPLSSAAERDPLQIYDTSFTADRFIRIPLRCESHLSVVSTGRNFGGVYFSRFTWDDVCMLDSWIDDLLLEDQPLLFVGMDEQKDAQLRELLTRHWRNSLHLKKDWFHAVTEIVPVVLGGGHDERRYHAITRSHEHFVLLEEPIQRTARAIEGTAWFQENAFFLRWSDEAIESCFVYPCGKPGRRRMC